MSAQSHPFCSVREPPLQPMQNVLSLSDYVAILDSPYVFALILHVLKLNRNYGGELFDVSDSLKF